MKHLAKKIIGGIIIAFLIFSYTIPAYAAWDFTSIGGGDVSSFSDTVLDSVLNNLGVDKAELKYQIQTMNASRRKKTPPSVSLNFLPVNPVPGEKVTAQATPSYFINQPKDLYFTWFLKSKLCGDDDSPGAAEKSKCDLNGNGRIDIEDYKIKAARIIASSDFNWEGASYSQNTDHDGYQSRMGGDDQEGKNPFCYIHNTETGDEYQIDCGHLFPDAPGETTGDDSFGLAEERFWRTDPESDDTAHTGVKDEATVAGLGISSFTWAYEQGDEVGIVVEGASAEPTQETDSSYRTMWAMPVQMCDFSVDTDYPESGTETVSVTLDSPIVGQTTTVTRTTTEDVSSAAANIATLSTSIVTTTTVTDSLTGAIVSASSTTASPTYETSDISNKIEISGIKEASDLNECLYDNLIDPAEGGGSAERLSVELTYSPKAPINDPTGTSGDQLIIQSSIINAKDLNYVKYAWQVYAADEINPDSWGQPLLKSELPKATQTTGIGLPTFKFNLNLDSPRKYLKIKLTATENVSGDVVREGIGDIVVPIYSTQKQISVFDTQVSESLMLSSGANQRCVEGIDKSVCPVAQNEIIALSIPETGFTDFMWTINGEPFSYQSCFFEGCSEEEQGNAAFFPILKNKGERYDINVSATNQETGNKINLTKVFEVTEPKIKIACLENCQPVLLGHYIDLDGKTWPDQSKNNFLANSENPIKLGVTFSGFSPLTENINWYVDGKPITTESADAYGYSFEQDGAISLLPKLTGESYDITANTPYAQSNLVKKALSQYWGASYNDFYETQLSDSITIEMTESAVSADAGSNKKILANLWSATPQYLAFLLRIVITAFLILVSSSFVLSLSPNLNENED